MSVMNKQPNNSLSYPAELKSYKTDDYAFYNELDIEPTKVEVNNKQLKSSYKAYKNGKKKKIILMCLVITALLILILSILIFYVIIPMVIKKTIGQANVSFKSILIDNVKSNYFHINSTLELTNTGSISTRIEPMVLTIQAMDKDTSKFTTIGLIKSDIPIKTSGKSSISIIDTQFSVTNIKAFNSFVRDLIFEQKVQWYLTAKANIQPISSSMPHYPDIPFEKQVTIQALNGLKDVQLKTFSLENSTEKQINLDLLIQIDNPSIFTMDLGYLTFSLEFMSRKLGVVQSIEHVILVPKENLIPLKGQLRPTNMNDAHELIQNFLTNKPTEVNAIAGPQATSLPLLATGMNGLSLVTVMPPFQKDLIESLEFTNLTLVPSTTDTNVTLSATMRIRINSPLGKNSPLNLEKLSMKASLNYEQKEIGTLDIVDITVYTVPSLTSTYETKFENIQLILTDTSTYQLFANRFIASNEVNPIRFGISGTSNVSGSFALGPLSVSNVKVDNEVVLTGLNGLSDIQVESILIEGDQPSQGSGVALTIKTIIENAGVTTVSLKDLTLNMINMNSVTLGKINVDVLSLKPGTNSLTMNGFISPALNDLNETGIFFSNYLNNQQQMSILTVISNNHTMTTASDLTVNDLKMSAHIPGIQGQLIKSINIEAFGLEFDEKLNNVYASGRIVALFQLPSNIKMSLNVILTNINFTIYIKKLTDEFVSVALMTLDSQLVNHLKSNDSDELQMEFKSNPLIILDHNAFQNFSASLLLTPNLNMTINGMAQPTATTNMGNLTLINIPVMDNLSLVGYNQFQSSDGVSSLLKINELDILESNSNSLILQVQTTISNPSNIYLINAGNLTLDMYSTAPERVRLGSILIENFHLESYPLETNITANGKFQLTQTNHLIAKEFISQMVSGYTNVVQLEGKIFNETSGNVSVGTSIPSLQYAIEKLTITTQIPGLQGDSSLIKKVMLSGVTLATGTGILLGLIKVLNATIQLYNPFNTNMTIHGMIVKAYSGVVLNQTYLIGTVNQSALRIPIFVPAKEQIISPPVGVTINLNIPVLTQFLNLGNKTVVLSLSGTINVTIGDSSSGLMMNDDNIHILCFIE